MGDLVRDTKRNRKKEEEGENQRGWDEPSRGREEGEKKKISDSGKCVVVCYVEGESPVPWVVLRVFLALGIVQLRAGLTTYV